MIELSKETVFTALIALKADKMQYEHLLRGVSHSTMITEYGAAIHRITTAIDEIQSNKID